ncbi:MAG: hypothetical protein KDB16_11620, partial [Acidimicrobiales bacterium]|nr:hypothetical protein [Acidimicrobiales bacterium]
SWSSIYNQPTAQFYHVDVDDQFPYLVYGSQQDNSSIAVPSSNGKGAINWADCYPPGTAESGYVAVKPGDPNVVYVGAIGSSPGGGDALQRYDHKTGQIQLVSVWPEGSHDGNSAEVRFQWTYPIMFCPHDPGVLYACGNKVFRTTDEGHSWEAISGDLTYADPETMGVSGPLTMDTAGAEMYATIFSFLPSAHRKGTLMAGSDDGLVHVSHDDGATWNNVTPAGLPKFSQVTMLAESPHAEGTVYMTVARHKMGDYAPYVFKTTDFGQSWQSIVNGLPADDFCRVVRCDPARPGLLYLGTELGVFVSFDDGDNWQTLQANLPVTPVYDLLVKGSDLVVATHGRSIWILDDLTQIHQVYDRFSADEHQLLTPRDAYRAPKDLFADFWGTKGGKNYHVTIGQNATFYLEEDETGHQRKRVLDAGDDLERGVRITYWLASKPQEPAILTILDHQGNEIDSFTSIIPEKTQDREGLYITADQGMNVFQWPMTHRPGDKMVDTEFHGRPGGPLALPGTYQARLQVGDWSMTQPFSLLKDPRVDTPTEHLVEQFELLVAIRDKLSEIVRGVNQIRSITKQIAHWSERVGQLDTAQAALDALRAVEDELVQREFTSEGDTLNYREKLFETLSGLPPIVSSADTRPTTQSYAVFQKLSGLADAQLEALQHIVDTEVAAVNQELAAKGVGSAVSVIGT